MDNFVGSRSKMNFFSMQLFVVVRKSATWTMGVLFNSLFFSLLSFTATAQTQLPECIGSFRHNCVGTITYANGDTYVGEFKNGKLNGKGTYTFPSGEKYVGEFKNGIQHGQATYTFPRGEKYVGDFKDGNRNGKGTMTWPNCTRYVGEFKDDRRTGQGTMTWPTSGDKYVGEFKDGYQNGQGTAIFRNGNMYVGEFKNDVQNGEGIEYNSLGVVIRQGRWVTNNRLAESYAIDPKRFPFNSSLTASVSKASAPDTVNEEGNCLETYYEAEKKRASDFGPRIFMDPPRYPGYKQ